MPAPDHDPNPFLRLDKRAFPDKRNTEKKPAPGKRKQPKTAPPERKPDEMPDEIPDEIEDALFLQAMNAQAAVGSDPAPDGWAEGILPLAERPPARKTRQTIPQPQAAPADPEPAQTILPETESSEFAAAMRGVLPLTGKGREIPPEPACKAEPPAASDCLRDFLEGAFSFALHHTDEYVEGHVIGLDSITIRKLQAGQLSPEGSLDLHGLNVLQAYQRLIGFMRNAYLRSWRTVLIVPGRGLNSPGGLPVLREKVQTWLTQEPLRRVVLAFCTAQPTAGGAGALYVLLRKMRKNQGKVQWDRNPVDPDLIL